MISFIKGKFVGTFDGGIIVENSGIGYQIFIADNSDIYLKKETEEVKVYTALIVREDDMSLYGFANTEELKMFRMLTTVNGIGAKAGMAILSSMPLEQIQRAIVYEDAKVLTKANGVGKKTAERVVLELKDKIKITTSDAASSGDIPVNVTQINGSIKDEAVEALMILGYSKFEATEVVMKITDEISSVEEIIKLALKQL